MRPFVTIFRFIGDTKISIVAPVLYRVIVDHEHDLGIVPVGCEPVKHVHDHDPVRAFHLHIEVLLSCLGILKGRRVDIPEIPSAIQPRFIGNSVFTIKLVQFIRTEKAILCKIVRESRLIVHTALTNPCILGKLVFIKLDAGSRVIIMQRRFAAACRVHEIHHFKRSFRAVGRRHIEVAIAYAADNAVPLRICRIRFSRCTEKQIIKFSFIVVDHLRRPHIRMQKPRDLPINGRDESRADILPHRKIFGSHDGKAARSPVQIIVTASRRIVEYERIGVPLLQRIAVKKLLIVNGITTLVLVLSMIIGERILL